MARAALAVQDTNSSGLLASYTAASVDGHAFDNSSGLVLLHVKNGSGVSTTVTLDIPGTVDGVAVSGKTVTVAAGAEKFIGPFKKAIYNQDDAESLVDDAVLVNAAPQASVTYAAVRITPA